jgi:GntR family transcriptional regulator
MQEEDVMAQQPLYHQIAETIREQIESGQLKRGSQLPTEIELRDVHGASRNTIRDAIKRLTSQGLVETRQGQGTYVTQIIDPFVTLRSPDPENGVSSAGEESATYLSRVDEQHRKAQASPPKVEVMPCPRKIALRLRITPGDQVISMHQVR